MPVSRRRKKKQHHGPNLRSYLRYQLTHLRDRLIARDGEVDSLFVRAYGVDRIDALDRGEAVDVRLYEVAEVVPQDQRRGLDPITRCTLDTAGRLVPYAPPRGLSGD